MSLLLRRHKKEAKVADKKVTKVEPKKQVVKKSKDK